MRHFISIADASNVTVGELRRAESRVGSDVAIVMQGEEPILAIHPGDLDQADAGDPIGKHLARLTVLEDSSIGAAGAGARVAAEPEFGVIVRQGQALLVPTPGEFRLLDIADSAVLSQAIRVAE